MWLVWERAALCRVHEPFHPDAPIIGSSQALVEVWDHHFWVGEHPRILTSQASLLGWTGAMGGHFWIGQAHRKGPDHPPLGVHEKKGVRFFWPAVGQRIFRLFTFLVEVKLGFPLTHER